MPRRMIDVPTEATDTSVPGFGGAALVARDPHGCVRLTVAGRDQHGEVATFTFLDAAQARIVASALLAFAMESEAFDAGKPRRAA